jgi:uncharacterized protein YndB with AHSA1/START domain
MRQSTFVYVTYIRTTPERLWSALTTSEFARDYWFGMHCESDWKVGSPWKLVFPDGRVADSGEIIAADPPRRLVIKWRNQWKPELNAEGDSLCTFEIETVPDVTPPAVKLSILHAIERPESKLIEAVSGGWPRILSNLKSLLETGELVLGAVKSSKW